MDTCRKNQTGTLHVTARKSSHSRIADKSCSVAGITAHGKSPRLVCSLTGTLAAQRGTPLAPAAARLALSFCTRRDTCHLRSYAVLLLCVDVLLLCAYWCDMFLPCRGMRRETFNQDGSERVLGPCGAGRCGARHVSRGRWPVIFRDFCRRNSHRRALQQDVRPSGVLPQSEN